MNDVDRLFSIPVRVCPYLPKTVKDAVGRDGEQPDPCPARLHPGRHGECHKASGRQDRDADGRGLQEGGAMSRTLTAALPCRWAGR